MTNRSRAWRRRKARLIVGQIKRTKDWIVRQFKDPMAKPGASAKHHKAIQQSRAQDLRRSWQLREDIADGVAG